MISDTVKEELNEMKAQCIAALDNLKEVTSENVERILSQAVIIEQKTDDMRDKYFKKQMQRLKKENVSRKAVSSFLKY